jgi:hypothetical protein
MTYHWPGGQQPPNDPWTTSPAWQSADHQPARRDRRVVLTLAFLLILLIAASAAFVYSARSSL